MPVRVGSRTQRLVSRNNITEPNSYSRLRQSESVSCSTNRVLRDHGIEVSNLIRREIVKGDARRSYVKERRVDRDGVVSPGRQNIEGVNSIALGHRHTRSEEHTSELQSRFD